MHTLSHTVPRPWIESIWLQQKVCPNTSFTRGLRVGFFFLDYDVKCISGDLGTNCSCSSCSRLLHLIIQAREILYIEAPASIIHKHMPPCYNPSVKQQHTKKPCVHTEARTWFTTTQLEAGQGFFIQTSPPWPLLISTHEAPSWIPWPAPYINLRVGLDESRCNSKHSVDVQHEVPV